MVSLKRGNQVEFRFFRPQAGQVYLVGDFNGWNRTKTPMTRLPSGEWTHLTALRQGTHYFKYLADGEWFLDYAAFGIEEGPFGWNSVVVVEPAFLPSRGKTPVRGMSQPARSLSPFDPVTPGLTTEVAVKRDSHVKNTAG